LFVLFFQHPGRCTLTFNGEADHRAMIGQFNGVTQTASYADITIIHYRTDLIYHSVQWASLCLLLSCAEHVHKC